MSAGNKKSSKYWVSDAGKIKVFSGHETFACRYGWLPKLYHAVAKDPDLFKDDEHSIVKLGIGRNMVKSIRFWGQSFGLIEFTPRKVYNTEFADKLFCPDKGVDPYLESVASLWKLHWKITTRSGIGAWIILFLDLKDNQISSKRFIDILQVRANSIGKAISESTASAHADILLRTYDWTRFDEANSVRDASGCPFQELHLLETSGMHNNNAIILNRGSKEHLDESAFSFSLFEFWEGSAGDSLTISLRSLLVAYGSPGVVFRLDEEAIYNCLEKITNHTKLELRPDGIGGVDLVAPNRDARNCLQEIAWQMN